MVETRVAKFYTTGQNCFITLLGGLVRFKVFVLTGRLTAARMQRCESDMPALGFLQCCPVSKYACFS